MARKPEYRGRVLSKEIITPAGRRCRLEDFEAVKRAIRERTVSPEIAIEVLDDQVGGVQRVLTFFTDAIRDCIQEIEFRDLVIDRVSVREGNDKYEVGKVKGKLLIEIVDAINYGHDIGIFPQGIEARFTSAGMRVRADSLYFLITAINKLLKTGVMLPEGAIMRKVNPGMRIRYDWEGMGVYVVEPSINPGVHVLTLDNNRKLVISGTDLKPIAEGKDSPYAELVVARRIIGAGSVA
ncbi:MAG: hypothetical protein WCV91_01650 [Candidatus Margulisiibacteriota bacterium]